MAAESSLPIPDFVPDILLGRSGLEAEFGLLWSTLAVVYGRAPGLLMPKPLSFMATSSSDALPPNTTFVRLASALATPLGVAGESVPIRDRLSPDRGVMFALSGELSSLAIAAMFGRASRSGDRRDNAGVVLGTPASFEDIGLFVVLNLELSAGISGFVGRPVLVC